MQELIAFPIDAGLVADLDDSRGQLSREEFIHFVLTFMLSRNRLEKILAREDLSAPEGLKARYVTRRDFEEYKRETEKIQLEFTSMANRVCDTTPDMK